MTVRPRRRNDDGQQALLLVMGIATIMVLLGTILVSSVDQQDPQVSRTLIGQDSYRALQAGVSDFTYGINQDPNAAACSGIASVPPTTPPTITPSPSCNYFTSHNVSLGTWQVVPNLPTGGGSLNYQPSEWVSIGYPVLNQVNQYVQVTVVGASGFANAPNSIQYQTANITLNATNDFLLNVTWSNFNALDTTALDTKLASLASQTPPQGCSYLWQSGGDANCSPGAANSGYFAPNFPTYGPVFSNDEVLATGCPTINNITTAAPQLIYGSTCSNFLQPAKNVVNHAIDVPPTTLAAGSDLSNAAKVGGCYYTGPTTITLTGTTGFTAVSAGTQVTAGGADSYSLASDTSTCPVNGSAALPSNGVIYVDAMPASCTALASANPLTAVYTGAAFSDGTTNSYSGETSAPGCEGDVILNGALSGALTIGVANNIVIDGNITYADCPSIATQQTNMNNASQSAWPSPCSITSTGTNDVLGMIANNYIQMNLPLHSAGTVNGVNQNGVPYAACAAGAPALNCTITNPIIMGSMLALTHAFSVPNFKEANIQTNAPIGEIDYWGSLAENFIDIEEQTSGSGAVGYAMNYNWDSRLAVLSPPHYLTPGTSAWATQSFSVTVGKCSVVWPVVTSTCPTTASSGNTAP
jgi:hypothetical protein